MATTYLPSPNVGGAASGCAPTPYLGTGTADSTTYLRGDGTWAVPSASASLNVADEGTNIANTPHTRLNFVGAGVVASDGGGGTATITISGSAGNPTFISVAKWGVD